MKRERSHNPGGIFSADFVRPQNSPPDSFLSAAEHSSPKRRIFVVRRTLWTGSATAEATRTRQIFVFDDHPESLRLALVHVGIPGTDPGTPRGSSWNWIAAAVAVVGAVAGIFWPYF